MDKNKKIVMLLFCGMVVCVFSGCVTQSPGLVGTTWKLDSYGREVMLSALPDVDTYITFGKDGQVGGSMGCNHFGGGYSVSGDKIIFGSLAVTEMYCNDTRIMGQEATVLGYLTGEKTFMIVGDVLTISGSDGSVVFKIK